MFLRALAAHMALHPNVVGRIREDGGGFLSGEQCAIGVRIQGIPTEQTVIAQGPNVTRSRYGRALSDLKLVLGIPGLVRRLQRLNSQIDLRRLEAGRINLEIERYVRKLFQNNRDFAVNTKCSAGYVLYFVQLLRIADDLQGISSPDHHRIAARRMYQVSYNDPYFPTVGKGRKYDLQMKCAPLENLGQYDCALIVTDHSDYDYAKIFQGQSTHFICKSYLRPLPTVGN